MKIVMTCTKNWNHYLQVAIYSLLLKNKVDTLYLFLENKDKDFLLFSKMFPVKIVIYEYKDFLDKYISHNNKNKLTRFSEVALIRLFISKIIPEEKVLYLDTDILVLDDISELWETNIDDYYIAAVEDIMFKKFLDYADLKGIPEKSINSGVLLMNLEKIRKDHKDDEFLDLIAKNEYRFPDQDVLNITCENKIMFLNNKYNSSPSTNYASKISIMHYSAFKNPWITKNTLYGDLWFDMEKNYLEFKDKNII